MAAKRLTTEEFIRRVVQRYGDSFTFAKTEYTTKSEKVIITCKKHGDIKVIPGNFIRGGGGCMRCTGYKVTKKDFIEKARKVFGDIYDYTKVNYTNTTTKVEVVCRKHGSFWIMPFPHYHKRTGCMKCFWDRKLLSLEEFIIKAKLIHGDRYDYSMVEYRSGSTPVKIGCPVHGIFLQQPRVHNDGSGCVQCFLDRNKSNTDEFIEKARVIHGDRYDYSRVEYVGNKTKVELICIKHGSFWVKPNAHLTGPSGCIKCKESKGESRIRVFLEKHGIEYFKEFKLESYKYRYDYYIPKYRLLIEHQGHQHFIPVELFGGVNQYLERVKNDEIKRTLAKQHGYYLLETNYRLIERNGIEIVLEMALRYNGHIFEEGTTITSNNGPRITEM